MSDISDIGEDEEILSTEKLKTWRVKDLKEWCCQHKLKISGSKDILVKRVYRAMLYADSDSNASDQSDVDESTPEPVSTPTLWKTVSTDDVPPIRDCDVKNYFVYHKNPTTGSRMNFDRQLKKARKLMTENYVFDIQMGEDGLPLHLMFLRCKCKASMLTSSYNVEVQLVKETGMVESGCCSCKAGQSGVCSHVGALLLTLVKISLPCTSTRCEWKPASASLTLEPARCCDIRIYNPEKDTEEKNRPYPGVYSAGPDVDQDAFVTDLLQAMESCNSDCALFVTLRGNPGEINEFLGLFNVPFNFADSVDLHSEHPQKTFREFVTQLRVTEDIVANLEHSTRGQGVNPNWKEARKNILTASFFGSIVKRQKVELDGLIKTIMYPTNLTAVKSLAYGRRKEAKARRDYASWHLKTCKNVLVEDRGLVISDSMPFLGASVDGMVSCDKCGTGIVEIKCPYGDKDNTYRNMTPEKCGECSKFCCTLEHNKLKLKSDHNYMYQVQGQMGVCNIDWVDFVIWTKRGISVERIHRDRFLWSDKIVPKLQNFYSQGIVAELFSRRIQRHIKLYS